MRLAVLGCGALVVRHKDTSWLFGAPEGVSDALAQAGIELPKYCFTTGLRAPGFGKLGPVVRFKEQKLILDGLAAEPVTHRHGTDYAIVAEDGSKVLFSERGDVSAQDVEGYTLAIIKNKHRSDKFPESVISWPWPDVEFEVADKEAHRVDGVALKVWGSMDDVPDNLKELDGAKLSVDQANFIARVAKGAGTGDKENWAIGISQFKKSYQKKDGSWVKRESEEAKKEEPQEATKEEPQTNPADLLGRVEKAGGTRLDILTISQTGNGYYADLGDWATDATIQALKEVGIDYGLEAPPPVEAELVWPTVKSVEDKEPRNINWVYLTKEHEWRWASVSSVADWDRQNELFTTKAMDWAIKFNKLLEKMGRISNKGPLRFRHIPGLDGGDCDTQVRVGDYLFESGSFRNTPLGEAMRLKMASEPGWGVSLGLLYADTDIVEGEYQRAAIFERSMTQDPAVAWTAISTKEGDMKLLNEEQLKQAAEELGMELTEVKTMYERAIAAGGPLGLKEFSTALKDTLGGDGDATEFDEQEVDMTTSAKEEAAALADALAELTEEEFKEVERVLGEVRQSKKAGKKMPPADMEEMMEDEEEGSEGETTPKKKTKAVDPVMAALLQQMQSNSEAMLAQTKAMQGMMMAVLTGGQMNQQATKEAMTQFLGEMPREQVDGFVSSRGRQGAPAEEENQILAQLKEMEKRLPGNNGMYGLFTSQKLNDRGVK